MKGRVIGQDQHTQGHAHHYTGMFQGFSLNESQLFVSSFRRILTSLANTGGHHQHFYHQTPILHFCC